MSTDNILTLVTELAERMLSPYGYAPKHVVLNWVRSCGQQSTAERLVVGMNKLPSAEEVRERILEAAAHSICDGLQVEHVCLSARHTEMYYLSFPLIGAKITHESEYRFTIEPAEVRTSEATLMMQLQHALTQKYSSLSPSKKRAYDRVMLACPQNTCTHTITVRRTAAEKTEMICKKHKAVMEAK